MKHRKISAVSLQSLDAAVAAASALFILLLTPYPYSFNEPENILWFPALFQGTGEDGLLGLLTGTFVQPFQAESYKLKHFEPIANVFLFVPLGGSLAYLVRRLSGRWIVSALVVMVLCPAFSLAIEFLQAFLPSRSSTIADIITNSLSALLGLASAFVVRPLLKPA